MVIMVAVVRPNCYRFVEETRLCHVCKNVKIFSWSFWVSFGLVDDCTLLKKPHIHTLSLAKVLNHQEINAFQELSIFFERLMF